MTPSRRPLLAAAGGALAAPAFAATPVRPRTPHVRPGDSVQAATPSVVWAGGGTAFHDRGSWIDGRRADLDAQAASAIGAAYTSDAGWDPAELPGCTYRLLPSAASVTSYVTRHTGPRH
ncbi:hypothetical protein [Streptomyces sp. VRA16 Mangrove soil]|uniref:hypothetical protein n=1 Tax=Streptomyces sp. VRA16 Mangrove soil TaxID=2817434 RepID=UPI001A9E81F7|nr:hypothetical protein [Streptomyces sp. VRA16 Mangrove soil]MBO1335254.1 hypothetical protein [Streptomyces sp. VRA16 Mangrove soil]